MLVYGETGTGKEVVADDLASLTLDAEMEQQGFGPSAPVRKRQVLRLSYLCIPPTITPFRHHQGVA